MSFSLAWVSLFVRSATAAVVSAAAAVVVAAVGVVVSPSWTI